MGGAASGSLGQPGPATLNTHQGWSRTARTAGAAPTKGLRRYSFLFSSPSFGSVFEMSLARVGLLDFLVIDYNEGSRGVRGLPPCSHMTTLGVAAVRAQSAQHAALDNAAQRVSGRRLHFSRVFSFSGRGAQRHSPPPGAPWPSPCPNNAPVRSVEALLLARLEVLPKLDMFPPRMKFWLSCVEHRLPKSPDTCPFPRIFNDLNRLAGCLGGCYEQ